MQITTLLGWMSTKKPLPFAKNGQMEKQLLRVRSAHAGHPLEYGQHNAPILGLAPVIYNEDRQRELVRNLIDAAISDM